jgi:hypothetical protein
MGETRQQLAAKRTQKVARHMTKAPEQHLREETCHQQEGLHVALRFRLHQCGNNVQFLFHNSHEFSDNRKKATVLSGRRCEFLSSFALEF